MADEYNKDYYKLLQDQNYETLLNKEVQLDNARNRALKYTNQNLANMGLASSGYGATAATGVEGNYLNALENANRTYQTQTQQNIKDAVDYTNNSFNNFLNELGSFDLSTEEKLKTALGNYGLLNGNGEIDQQLFSEKYGSQNWGTFRNTLDNIGTINDQNAGTIDMNAKQEEEIQKAITDEMAFIEKGMGGLSQNLREGDCIKVSNNTKDKKQAYYIIRNGQWVRITKDQYDKAQSKYWVRSHENTKNMIVDYNGTTIYDNGRALSDIAGGSWLAALNLPLGLFQLGQGIARSANTKSNYDKYLEALQKGNQ